MVWSQFFIQMFGLHFGNSVLDNSSWDKISHSLTRKSHTCEEGGAHLKISFSHLLMNFEKLGKSDFWKTEKICWRYHHFRHVYQKPQIWSACTDIIFCHFRSFFDFLPHYWPQILKFGKNVKKHLDILSFYTCVPLIETMWCMVPEIWSSIEFFCHFGQVFALLPLQHPEKLKNQKCKKILEISSFYLNVPKIMIICYTVPELWRMTDVIVIFILGYQYFFKHFSSTGKRS